MLGSLHGNKPTTFQLVSSYGVGLGAALLVLVSLEFSWKTALLAFLALDWVGGIVANSAETVRDWWRERPEMSRAFIAVHLIELPIVFWLSGGGVTFALFGLVLAAKLSIFLLGQPSLSVRTDDP